MREETKAAGSHIKNGRELLPPRGEIGYCCEYCKDVDVLNLKTEMLSWDLCPTLNTTGPICP